jgi:hypothetical protein
MMTGILGGLAMSSEPRIVIDRFTCRFNLPAGLDDPYGLADRLEEIARRDVMRTCAELITALPDDSEAVYRIRRLRLNLWIDAQTMTESDIARSWTSLLEHAIAKAMTRVGTDSVIRFDTPRQFVTAFLRDLLNGRAWGCWYYDEFRTLQSLPAHTIALHLLTPRPEWIAPVLLELDSDARLIERWTINDIARLWMALGVPTPPEIWSWTAGGLLATLLDAWEMTPASGGLSPDARARNKLRLWLTLTAENSPFLHDSRLPGAIHALVDLAALTNAEPDVAPLLAMQTPLYAALIARIRVTLLADVLEWLPQADAGQIADMVEGITQRSASTATTDALGISHQTTSDRQAGDLPVPARRGATLVSEVGGIFLLLPALVELGVWEIWRGLERAREYLFVVALKTLGGQRAPLLLGDPMLAAFAGLSVPPLADARLPLEADVPPVWAGTLDKLTDQFSLAEEREMLAREADQPYFALGERLGYPWLRPNLEKALSRVVVLALHRTAARLPGFGKSSAQYTAQQFIAQPASLRTTEDVLEVRLRGGALSVVLQLAGLPWEVRADWLTKPVRLTL